LSEPSDARERGSPRRRYAPEEKRALIAAYEAARAAGETMDDFAARHGVSTASVCKWRQRVRAEGDAGLQPRANPRNARGPHRGAFSYTPEQRRAAVEAFHAAGQPLKDFARLWGVARETLRRWERRYRAGGPQALEPARRKDARRARASGGSQAGSRNARPRAAAGASELSKPSEPSEPGEIRGVARRLAAPVRALIASTSERFQSFGLRKIRDYLLRFHGVKVSTGGVKSALLAQGLQATQPVRKKVRRRKPAPRFFERARPMQLWQTDITSFLLGRHRERAYLTVFLDDRSRYVVSFALHLQQKSELVIEALKDGVARFGKPHEILSDQGRQYFSWRGKSEFQRLLQREGIGHVVARTHHPQTLGKCERLWETIKRELLERVALEDLEDARARLAHYFAHYNFFRPHQGIGGLVPADRFFGAQDAARATIQAQLSTQELALALGEGPRAPVFLFGQIGDEQVALHGERGRLVIQTEQGGRRELALDLLGVSALAKSQHDGGQGGRGSHAGSVGDPQDVARSEECREVRGEGRGDTAERAAEHVGPVEQREQERGSGVGAAADLAGGAARGGAQPDRGERAAGGGDAGDGRDAPPAPTRREAGEVSAPAAPAAAGEGAVDGGQRGREAERAPGLLGDARVLARQDRQVGSGAAAGGEGAADLAAQPAGARRDGGGALEAAADPAALPAPEGSGGGSQALAAQDCAAGAGALVGGETGRALEGAAGSPGECSAAGAVRGEAQAAAEHVESASGEENACATLRPSGGES
jgi:transposase InsO family protein